MKYVKQITIITGMTLAGEALNWLLPLPVPAGVYGLFLMLAALMSGLVKLESVEGTGNFLLTLCLSCLSRPWRASSNAWRSCGPCWRPFS